MADEKEKQTEANGAESAAPQKSGKVVFLAILGCIILINAVVAYFLVTATMKQIEPERETKESETEVSAAVDAEATGTYADSTLEAIVNISGTEGLRFLKVTMVMEYDAKKYKELGAELNRKHVVLKNMLIDMLSSMTLEELQAENARSVIRKRFLSKANTMLPEEEAGKLSNVYLTEFIIQ